MSRSTSSSSAQASMVDGGAAVQPRANAANSNSKDAQIETLQKPRKRNILAVLLISFGVGIATLMPTMVALPVVIARLSPENKDVVLGTVLGVQAFMGMALAPFFGALSDRTTSRLGMRRPGLIIGGSAIVVGLGVLGFAPNVPTILVGVFLTATGSALSGASSFALIPDLFPDRQRGRILGFKTLVGTSAGMAASIVGPMLLNNQVLLFGAGAIVLAACYFVAVPLIDDRRLDPAEVTRESLLRTAFSAYAYNPKSAPDFSWVFASRAIITLGIALGTSFAVYFLTDQLDILPQQLAPLISLNAVLSLAGTAVGTLVGAVLADKVASRKLMVLIAACFMAAGAVTAALAPSVPVFFVGTAILTFSIGLFIPTDGALVMSVLPGGNTHVARFMAIITIADQLPRSIGPLIAPAVIALGGATAMGGYPVLYISAAAVAIIGGLVVRKVRSVR